MTLVERIAGGAAALDVALAADSARRLGQYIAELQRWNRRINLVARADEQTLVARHVIDCLALCRLLDRAEVRVHPAVGRWYDIGSGAGLPGLVVAAARPELRWRLVEPTGKKAAFIRHAASVMGLANVAIDEVRLDALDPPQGPVSAVSRATFAPPRWVEHATRLVGPGGLLIAMLAGDGDPTVEARAWHVDRFKLPRSGAARVNVLLQVPPAG